MLPITAATKQVSYSWAYLREPRKYTLLTLIETRVDYTTIAEVPRKHTTNWSGTPLLVSKLVKDLAAQTGLVK